MADPLRTYYYHTAMLALSGSAGLINFITVCAILCNRALRKRQNVFIFNLALADCASAVTIFITNFYDYPGIPFKSEGFAWYTPLFTTGLMISILSTLALAIERLIVLRFDVHRQIVTARRSIATCVIGWVAVSSTYLLVHTFYRMASCLLLFAVSPCIILASLVITALCYIFIYKKISSISDNDDASKDPLLQRRAKNSKKILVTFALIVASNIGCWVIMCCVLLVEVFGRMEETLWFNILRDAGFALVCVNGLLNPAIIWFRLTEFRGQLNACFGKGHPQDESETTTQHISMIDLKDQHKQPGHDTKEVNTVVANKEMNNNSVLVVGGKFPNLERLI